MPTLVLSLQSNLNDLLITFIKIIFLNNITLINGYLEVPKQNNDSEKLLKNLKEMLVIGMKDVPVDGYFYGRNSQPENGSNKKALLSAISIIELVLEQKTGQDNFIASIIGKPNPSYSDG